MAGDPLHTRLCEEYGAEFPIVAFAHTKDVIAAASNAGAIGVLGASSSTPDELDSDIRWIKERVGDKPFGIDLIIPASFVQGNLEDLEAMIPQEHRDFVDGLMRDNEMPEPKNEPSGSIDPGLFERAQKQLEVIIEHQIPIFASGLGSPAFIMDRLHDAGTKAWGLIGLRRQAVRELEAGVDTIIAQGGDSGGHSGRIGTFSLVPEVTMARDQIRPESLVLAAGGVTTGRHIAAAIALGADGIWCGTIWQATNESETEMYAKQKLLDAVIEDAVQSRATSGKPVRQVRSKWTEAWDAPEAPDPLPMPLQPMLVAKIKQSIDDHHLEDWSGPAAGQGVGHIKAIKPARQVIFDLMEEAQDAMDRLQGSPVGV
ncbi:MAG: nitronate monooxygenase family protein [Chloroflexota bacterium]|nr:nitronate monooxygenase family protein [Chloroflexota bacterium]MDE2696574.1 nitronate monooxygenase family protein [Chloroflexota bacterium]MXZ46862.1 nitronate monooxygenase [Chloroflexota bacterium]MYE31370.1 nitronate monooxygenase [Chloroflexota bacterium]